MPLRPGQPLVTLEAASVTLGGTAALREVDLALAAGDRVALLGGNGSGKSTLLRVLRGDQWLDPERPGRRIFHRPSASPSPIGARERLVPCGPEDQDRYVRRDLELSVEAVIRSGLDDALYPSAPATPARAARVARAAAAVGVTGLLGRSFLTLSRGEARRTLVARALAPEPDALLLDEVCDGLDAAARADLLARLSALPRRVAIVTATHRAEEIFPGITRVLWLEGGRVVASGPPAEVVPRWRAAFGARPSAASRERPARRRIAAMAAPGLAPVFALRGVTVLVEGRAILDRVTWRVGPGEAWAVTGPNGAGKSTLLRLLAGDEQPARGTIRRLGLGLHADATALRARLGVVSPELQARHRNDASGLEVVLSGYQGSIGLARRPLAGERAGAAAALARLGLARLARRRFLGCSYGEQRLLLLARALAPDPEVLLLDEPFAGLDPGARARLGRIVGRLARAGTGLVLVTHHEDEVPGAVTHRARLEAGRLVVTP